MNYKLLLLTLLSAINLLCAVQSHAQTVANDTIRFSTENIVVEDDPNSREYCFTLFSPDGKWKMQLDYHADSMFGTFTNDDFDLQGSGKYYNFVRNPQNDMQFYTFTDMEVTVSDEVTHYRIDANCLASNKTRFLVEGIVPVLVPTDTIASDLGYATVTENYFYQTYVLRAENDDFRLEYGIVSQELYGTFYRADLLLPELYDKKNGRAIEVTTATAVHTQEGETSLFTIDILGSDLTDYHLTMWNAPIDVPIVAEEEILIPTGVVLQDLSDMYGCWQLSSQNSDYMVAIAFTPDAVESGQTEWSKSDIFMPYTLIVRTADNQPIDIHDINVRFSNDDGMVAFLADVTSREGVLYHITLILQGGESFITPKETINIDFGPVAIIDYSQGIGTIGLGGIVPDKYQMRLYLNTHELSGSYTTGDILTDHCDIMVVTGNTYRFHDAWTVNTTFEPTADGSTLVTVDMLAVDTVLYHATMVISPMECLRDGQYSIDNADGTAMLALMEGQDAEGQSIYTLQFQDISYDDDYMIQGDGSVFSFRFAHQGDGIGGTYGYTDGTLDDTEIHTLFENGAEVRIAPVAGTLHVKPVETLTLHTDGSDYRTNLYEVTFQFVGQNNVIYEGTGRNFLLCIDTEGEFLELTEPELASIRSLLEERGYRVRKVMKDGKFIIESLKDSFDMLGRRQ